MKVSIRTAEGQTTCLTPGIDEAAYFKKLEALFASQLEALGSIPEAVADVELSVSVISEAEMHGINKEYRDVDAATDVLSFPLWEEEGVFTPPADWETLPLGDVVVCPEVIARNAGEEGKEYLEELTLVLCHGVLHLAGFDHDTEERENQMWELQACMVKRFLADDADVG